MKYAIIGSRGCSVDIELKNKPDLIISGGAVGIDQCAKKYAIKNNIPLIEILPDYTKHNPKSAPLIRNKKIVEMCDILIAYWDGRSHGTRFVIDYAHKLGKKVYIKDVLKEPGLVKIDTNA